MFFLSPSAKSANHSSERYAPNRSTDLPRLASRPPQASNDHSNCLHMRNISASPNSLSTRFDGPLVPSPYQTPLRPRFAQSSCRRSFPSELRKPESPLRIRAHEARLLTREPFSPPTAPASHS